MNLIDRLILKGVVNRMGKMLDKILKGNMGWKTVSAAALIAVLVLLRGFGVIDQAHFDVAVKAAEALGLFGIRDAISKLPSK